MSTLPSDKVTGLLIAWSGGNREALERLIPLVHDELHLLAERYMQRERRDHTLQPTALIHEAYFHLVDQNRVQWQNRAHFFGVAARVMRHITLNHARHHRAAKRGGGMLTVSLDESVAGNLAEGPTIDIIELDDALTRLAALDPQQSQLVELRFFGGLTIEETAEVLRISTATVKREWRTARAWLQCQMQPSPMQPGPMRPSQVQPRQVQPGQTASGQGLQRGEDGEP